MVEVQKSTEEKILAAAKSVFLRKGFDGSRMQEIADEAGINKALLHYYFRSKDNLFDAVFMDAFQTLFKKVFTTLESSATLEEKVRYLFNEYISFMQANPFIPAFILNSIQYNPERVTGLLKSAFSPKEVFKKVRSSLDEAGFKNEDHLQFVVNLISLSVFPIVAKPIITTVLDLSEKEFGEFIERRKVLLPELVLKNLES